MKKEFVKLNKAKVLFVCTTDNMIWQFLLPHIQFLKDCGADVECVCSKTGFWFDELKNKYGLNIIEVPFARKAFSLANIKAYKIVKRIQKENNYNLIFCQQAIGGLIGRLIGKKFKIPVVYTAHGFSFFKGNNKLKNFLYKSVEKWLSKYTDVLITMNDEDYNATKNWHVKYKYRINGIGFNENKYNNEEFDKNSFKESLHIEKDSFVILSVSEFIKRKNYKTMIESFAKLCDNYSNKNNNLNVTYLICGCGTLFDEMKEYAKQLNVDDKIKFLGYRKDINKIMQISNIFFHQSFNEGLTMGIMEAMHFGLPVVTSNARGNKDLIVNNKGGIITDCLDINAQVEALDKLIGDENLRKEMSDFNKNEVKKYYLKQIIGEFKKIYEEINLL